MPEPDRKLILALLLVAGLAIFFVDLGGSSIWDANEAFYVETPREMIERGDYIFPTFNYEPRLNKPVLSYWIVAGFYKLFGVSAGVQRIPIAIGGVLLVVVAFVLGRLAYPDPRNRSGSLQAGLWAALGLAVSPRLVMFSRRIFIDIYITLFMAATLLFFALAERHPQRRRLFLTLMYISIALGILTKGPIAAALPGLVFLIYLLVHREVRRVTEMMLPAGIAIVLAIVAPWYAALYRRDGWTHIISFFLGENVGRFSDGIGYDTGRGPWFYIGVLFSDGFPWSMLLFAAVALWWRLPRAVSRGQHTAPGTRQAARTTDRAAPGTQDGARIQTLLLIWILAIVAFFSLSASKQDLYIYPVIPAVAALGGMAIAASAPGVRGLSALIGLLFAIAGAGVLWVFNASGNVYALDGVAPAGLLAIAGGLAALGLWAAGRWQQGLLAFLAAGIAFNWIFVLQVLPSFEKYKPVPELTRFLQPRLKEQDVVAHYSVDMPSMVFYLRRHIEVTYDRETFLTIMRQPQRVFAMLWAEEYETLKADMGVPTCAIHHTPSFNIKLGAVINREPLPTIVVITNQCPFAGD